tara:strand:+ start:4467 stop:5300 length:834 start_codon:yes stop_codon:yes gene_type:complete
MTDAVEPTDESVDTSTEQVEKSWIDELPEEFREEKVLTKYKSVNDLAKGHVHLSRMQGSSINIPGEDATDEDRAEFYTKLGRPESSKDYELERPDLPDDLPYDENAVKGFQDLAFELGLNNDQAKGIMQFYNQWMSDSYVDAKHEADQVRNDGEAELRKHWGMKGYDRNVNLATRTVKEFGDENLVKVLEETNMGSHPAMVKFCAEIGKRFSEAKPLAADSDTSFLDADSAKKEINYMLSKGSKHKYASAIFDATHQDHQEAMRHRDRLYDMAYGDE